jgi:predicted transposase YdaD
VGDLATQFTCSTILLWEHETRILSGELKEFAPFLPLLHRRRDPRIIKVQKMLLAQLSDPELREDLTAAAILVDIRAFGTKVVLSEFTKKELSMLKDTSFVQDWLTESLQKGKLEGKLEGKLSVIEIILQQKLGALSPRLRSQLQKLDNKKLDRLTVKLQQITSQKDLQTWLKNGASRHASR